MQAWALVEQLPELKRRQVMPPLACFVVHQNMKPAYLFFVAFFVVTILVLSACQSSTAARISCEPTSNPFDDNPMMSDSEYQGGYFPNVAIDQVCKFSGEVAKDQYFKQAVTQDLVFCLLPTKLGWEISVTDSLQNDCEENFSVPVTPPWHGENPIFIRDYQFRNQNNTDSNDGSVNAPQENRGFNFVFSQEDYEVMRATYRCSHWGMDCPTDTSKKEETEISWSRGIMIITELELGNLIPDEQAWIETMKFEVEIYLPAD